MSETISDRSQQILHLLMEHYMRDGQAVSSKIIAEDKRLSLSSATIRHVLADLEDKGYLRSLHTSSGRVPTPQAYKLFVQSFLTAKKFDENIAEELKQKIHPNQSINNLVSNASSVLSQLTHMTGLVTIPKIEKVNLRHIEFLPLSNNQILVILVLDEKEVQNRIIQTERSFSRSELENAANFLNKNFSGMDVNIIREKLLETLQMERVKIDAMMQAALTLTSHALEPIEDQNDYVLTGEHHLLGLAEETNVAQLRKLFNLFTQKREILHLLDQFTEAQGVQIFVGGESGYETFDGCSLITAPYSVDEEVVGVLAVIGPHRMQYDKVIPIVEMSSRILSYTLNREKVEN